MRPVPPDPDAIVNATPPEPSDWIKPQDHSSGELTLTAACCPPAVEFYGAVVRENAKFFGYDPLVNRTLPNDDSHVYWYVGPQKNKVDIEFGSLSEPTSRTAMDGSAWFSVGVGETTRFAAEFLGSGCFENVVFESQDPSIAVAETAKGTSTLMEMAVKGVGVGETTIIARCEGTVVGWVHIWVTTLVTITLDVGSLYTPQTSIQLYNPTNLQDYLNIVFRPMRIQFQINDAGVIRMPDVTLANPLDAEAELFLLEPAITAAAGGRLVGKYHIIFAVPEASLGDALWGGSVPGGVGTGTFAFIYEFLDEYSAYQTVAHELGHILNLSHPVDDHDGDEFTADHRSHLSATDYNVIVGAEGYLMGYGHTLASQPEPVIRIGYHQWVKARRN